MSHGAEGEASTTPRRSRYERARSVPPVRLERYPKRQQVSVDVRLARLARSAVVRYEDFFVPAGTWADLHRRTSESIRRSSRDVG